MNSRPIAIAMTDCALEFATLAQGLLDSSKGDGGPAFEGLAKFVGIASNDLQFFEVIGMIGARAVNLVDFINNLQDEYLDDDLRKSLTTSVREISQIINPSQMTGSWSSVAGNHLQLHNIRLLRSFSRTAREYRPLRAFGADEQAQLLDAIDEALKEVREDEHFPRWTLNQLEEGIHRLKLVIRHFDFFGHDAAMDQLIKVQAEAKYTFDFLATISSISEHKLVKTIQMFSLGATLLLLPPRIEREIPYYRSHIQQIMQEIPKLIGGPPKQITYQRDNGAGVTESADPGSTPSPTIDGP